MKPLHLLMLLCAVAIPVGSCARPVTKYDVYKSNLEKLRPGMSVDEFVAQNPKAIASGGNTIAGRSVTVFRLEHRDAWAAYHGNDDLYFYFVDSKLFRWGESDNYPKPEDFASSK